MATSHGADSHTVVVELDENGREKSFRAWDRDDLENQYLSGSALADDGTLYVAGLYADDEGLYHGGLYGALDDQAGHLWSHLVTEPDDPDGTETLDAAVLSDGKVVFVGSGGIHDESRYLWIRKTEP